MTDSRDPNTWSARQIERNPEGPRQAQEAFREIQEQEWVKQAVADDLARFTEEFVRNGGMQSAARAAWEKRRNESAAEAAHDTAAWRLTQSEARRVVTADATVRVPPALVERVSGTAYPKSLLCDRGRGPATG
jgi:hypothetical protein